MPVNKHPMRGQYLEAKHINKEPRPAFQRGMLLAILFIDGDGEEALDAGVIEAVDEHGVLLDTGIFSFDRFHPWQRIYGSNMVMLSGEGVDIGLWWEEVNSICDGLIHAKQEAEEDDV
jgi:hypothetical protein